MSATTDKIKGNWNQLKGKVIEKYGELTDDEWKKAEGKVEQLAGIIQEKTGQKKQEIKDYIDSL